MMMLMIQLCVLKIGPSRMRYLIEAEIPPRLTGQWAAKKAAHSRSRCDPPIMSGLSSGLAVD